MSYALSDEETACISTSAGGKGDEMNENLHVRLKRLLQDVEIQSKYVVILKNH